MHPMTEKKEQLKEMAKKIRELKSLRKEKDLNFDIWLASKEFRYEHIAYCMVRGRMYEQIEQKVRENNKPNWYIINRIRENLQNRVNEANEYWQLKRKSSMLEVSNG